MYSINGRPAKTENSTAARYIRRCTQIQQRVKTIDRCVHRLGMAINGVLVLKVFYSGVRQIDVDRLDMNIDITSDIIHLTKTVYTLPHFQCSRYKRE